MGREHVDFAHASLRRALDHDVGAQAWIVEEFSPYVLALARRHHRICARLGLDPEDLVQEVWGIFFHRVRDGGVQLPPADRTTPALMKFLSTSLSNELRNRNRKGRARPMPRGHSATDEGSVMAGGYWARLPAETTGILSKVMRGERETALYGALDSLSERDREVLCLRGLSQMRNDEVARFLGLEAKAAVARYRRALERLRAQLGDGVLAELAHQEEQSSGLDT